MDEAGIVKVCDALGLLYSNAYRGNRRGPHLSISCFPGDQEVMTSDGLRPIADIEVGDRVLTKDSGFRRVLYKHVNDYNDDIYKLKIKGLNYEMSLTKNHNIFIVRKEDYKKGYQRKYRNNDSSVECKEIKIPVSEANVGDYMVLPSIDKSIDTVILDKNKYKTVNKAKITRNYPTIVPVKYKLDYDFCYLLGLWLAEGSAGRKDPYDYKYLNFTFCRGEPAVQKCVDIIKNKLNINPGVYSLKSRPSVTDVRLNNWLFTRWVIDEFNTGAANKIIPNFIINAPIDGVRGFIDGYFAGDGYYYKGKTKKSGSWKGISTVSKSISYQLPILLSKIGIICRRTTRPARIDKNGTNHKESYEVCWSEAQQRCSGKLINNKIYYPIKAIEFNNISTKVYNLTVNYDETYVVGALVVKNCPLAGFSAYRNGPRFHKNRFDDNMSCSVKVVDDGPSLVRCHSAKCGYKGSFASLIKYSIKLRKNPPELRKLLEFVEKEEQITLDGIISRIERQIEFDGAIGEESIEDRDVLDESMLDQFKGSVPRYALNRGLTIETCKRWELGYDKRRERLVFPIRRTDGRLIGITGRDITGEAKTKYHNYSGLNKIKYIYGSHLLEPGKSIVIVEGPIDTNMADQNLYPICNILGTLGGGFSEEHIRTIANNCPPEVYIFTDGDSAGREMAERINYSLSQELFIRKLIRTPEGADPATLTKEKSIELFNNAEIIFGKKIKW